MQHNQHVMQDGPTAQAIHANNDIGCGRPTTSLPARGSELPSQIHLFDIPGQWACLRFAKGVVHVGDLDSHRLARRTQARGNGPTDDARRLLIAQRRGRSV